MAASAHTDIVYLYTSYDGDSTHQATAWLARILGAVIVVEIIWARRVGHVHGMGADMRVDPPTDTAAPDQPV